LIAYRIWLLLLTLVLAASSTLTAHASACSNWTIQGSYAFTPPWNRFPVYTLGKGIVVGFTNHVTFQPADRAPFEHTFTETWILVRTDSGLKALRANYSRFGPIDSFAIAK